MVLLSKFKEILWQHSENALSVGCVSLHL